MCIPRTMPLKPSHSVDSIVESMFIRILPHDVFWQICSCTFQAKKNFAIVINAYQVHVVIHVFYGRSLGAAM